MANSLPPASKLIGICVSLFPLLAAAAEPQTKGDRVAEALEKLASPSYDDWKANLDVKTLISGDPAKPEFNDSAWPNLKLGAPLQGETCWFRKSIVLPAHVLGQAVAGPLKLILGINGSGELWVNGQSRGTFSRNGEFELTKDAKPGQKFVIVIKASNTARSGGSPVSLRLNRAELSFERSASMRQPVQDLALSLRAGQKLLSFDTFQTSARQKVDPGVDHSTISKAER